MRATPPKHVIGVSRSGFNWELYDALRQILTQALERQGDKKRSINKKCPAKINPPAN
jgi:hypothetical protein